MQKAQCPGSRGILAAPPIALYKKVYKRAQIRPIAMVMNVYLIRRKGKQDKHELYHRAASEKSIDRLIRDYAAQNNEITASNLSLEQAVNIAQEKHASITFRGFKRSLEKVIETCGAVNVDVEGQRYSDVRTGIREGEYDSKLKEYFNSSAEKNPLKKAYKTFMKANRIMYEKVGNAISMFQKISSKALCKAAKADEVKIFYSSDMQEQEAKAAYGKIASREMVKSSIMFGINTLLIPIITPISYTPPFVFIPATSLPFVFMWAHSFKVMRAIRKSMKKASYYSSDEVALLESMLHKETAGTLVNEDLIEYYNKAVGE